MESSLIIPAEAERFREACTFVRSCAAECGAPESLLQKLDLVIEELVINIASYAYPEEAGKVEIRCLRETASAAQNGKPDSLFCLCFCDWGVAFNPLQSPRPDMEIDLHRRNIGGLGLHLVLEMADTCAYERRNGMNEFKVCFEI